MRAELKGLIGAAALIAASLTAAAAQTYPDKPIHRRNKLNAQHRRKSHL